MELENTTENNILVVGAGGFVGTNLLSYLSTQGVAVKGISRSYLKRIEAKNIELITAELSDEVLMEECCAWADVVIYLASEGAPATADLDIVNTVERGVLHSVKFFECCARSGVKKLVYISSGGTVYGDAEQVPTSEDAALKPSNAYSIGKVAIEQYLALYKKLGRLDSVVLRASNPYGPFQFATKSQGVIGSFIGLALKGEPVQMWGNGSAIRDYIYIDDLCDAVVKAIAYDGEFHTFNIGSGIGHNLVEVIEVIRSAGLEVNVITKPGVENMVQASVLDVSLAEEELGWKPAVGFELGVKKFVRWFSISE